MSPVIASMYYLLVAVYAFVAMAAPPPLEIHRRVPLPVKATMTRDATASVCTNGVPASKQHPAGYPINDYTVVTPDSGNWTSYSVTQDWYRDHFLSGPHIISVSHLSDPYGPFKCQYTCNAAGNCNSYLVWYANVGTDDEHLNCVKMGSIPASVFVQTNGTISAGAYDRLCKQSSSKGGA